MYTSCAPIYVYVYSERLEQHAASCFPDTVSGTAHTGGAPYRTLSTMRNPVDRAIKAMTFGVGAVGLLILTVFQLL